MGERAAPQETKSAALLRTGGAPLADLRLFKYVTTITGGYWSRSL
jgi:hypothetical protein